MELLYICERYPFSRFCLALLIGLWVGARFTAGYEVVFYLSSLLFFIITLTIFYPPRSKYRWVPGLCWILFIFGIGIIIFPRVTPLPSKIEHCKCNIVGTVLRETPTKTGSTQLIVEIKSSNLFDSLLVGKKVSVIFKDSLKKRHYTCSNIAFRATLFPIFPINNPYQFDYNSYLLSKGIYASAYVEKIKLLPLNIYPLPLYQTIAFKANRWLKETYHNCGFESDELGVMLALIDGDRTMISSDVKKDYQQTGTTHILAVSGLHVGVIMEMLLFLFGWLDRYRLKMVKVVVIISLLWLYTIIAGLEASILRATIMFSILLLSRQFQRKARLENSLFLSAFIILLLMPQSLLDAGFWLSYLAVTSIVLFSAKIENLVKVEQSILKKGWQLIAVTISAQIVTTPYILYLFGTFSSYFLISNILILPVVPVAMFGGIGVASLSFITTNFTLGNSVVIATISYMNGVVDFLQKLPLAQLTIKGVSFCEMMLIYLIMMLLCFYFTNRKIVYLYLSQISLSLLLLFIAYGVYQNKIKDEVVVFSCQDVVAVSKNGNSVKAFLSNNTMRNLDFINNYMANVGERSFRFDAMRLEHSFTPIFYGNSFGLVIMNKNQGVGEINSRYRPSFVVIQKDYKDNFEPNKSLSQKSITLVANHVGSAEQEVLVERCWDLSKQGAFIR